MHHQFLSLSKTLDYKKTKKSFAGEKSTRKFHFYYHFLLTIYNYTFIYTFDYIFL